MFHSLVYRGILALLSIFVLIRYDSFLPQWVLVSIVALYGIASYFFKKKEKDILRLFCDFLFINFVLYGKGINDPLLYFIVVLPMVNAVNFTGKKEHIFLLILLTIATIYLNLCRFTVWPLLPIFAVLLLYALSIAKYRTWKVERSIVNKVDSYFLAPKKMKSHEIYVSIIHDLNTYFRFRNDEGISRIMVYTLKEDTLWLVNASSFMWERVRILDKEQLETLREKQKYVLMNETGNYTYLYYINKYEIEYVFACDISVKDRFRLYIYRFDDMMRMSFSKMAMLLNTEYRMNQRREEKFLEIRDNVQYVNQAIRVMHFIRNKMTPLANVIAYYRMEDKLNSEMRELMRKRFRQEVNQAGRDLKDILKYADYLLDKSNNPFAETEVEEISLMKVFIIISELAQMQLGVAVDLDKKVIDGHNDGWLIHFNVTNLKIMLTDWIANMRKNNGGYVSLSMKFELNKLIISCVNSYIDSEDDIMKLIRDLNSKAKDAVLEGKNYGHGIYYIKSLEREYGFCIKAEKGYIDSIGSTLNLNFEFSVYGRKENLNI